ncbi:uncharacterized protein PG986_008164 [Apiospora aurea]|uniref:Polyketide synthase n=1 Tax=Apiospora aurea TaxID=335848 RepID=A0ABR1QEM7_9PEZI
MLFAPRYHTPIGPEWPACKALSHEAGFVRVISKNDTRTSRESILDASGVEGTEPQQFSHGHAIWALENPAGSV